MNDIGGIILAAGKGSRMKSSEQNKVTLHLHNKPMVLYGVELMEELHIDPIIVVVGFAQESVRSVLGERVLYAEQEKRLGTGHAVLCGLGKVTEKTKNVLVLQGDDSAFYKKEVLVNLLEKHIEAKASITFLTINLANPTGLGRVIRDGSGKVKEIVEEKDATEDVKKIKEINPACYVFSVAFLRTYLPRIKKSPVTGEYYLTHLIDMAIADNERLETVQGGFIPWRGVNTKEELVEAERLLHQEYGK